MKTKLKANNQQFNHLLEKIVFHAFVYDLNQGKCHNRIPRNNTTMKVQHLEQKPMA